MKLKFDKYQGAGNDFIIFDSSPCLSQKQITNLCHRNLGIGADGVIFVELINQNEIKMSYYNSDGSYASFCGNGARCAILFAKNNFPLKDNGLLWVNTVSRKFQIKSATIVKIQLGTPSQLKLNFNISEIKESLNFVFSGVEHACLDYSFFNLKEFKEMKIEILGKKIREHDFFKPKGTNVNFYWNNNNKIHLRTFERGVEAETLACGTGATAVSYIQMIKENDFSPKEVITKLGTILKVSHKESSLHLEGPAYKVFTGFTDIL